MIAALLLMVLCTPLPTCPSPGGTCASPTPVAIHDPVADAALLGYTIYYREPGGVFQKLVDLPCEEPDESGAVLCRTPTLGAALQRYCPSCVAGSMYEFAVKAYTATSSSPNYSNTVSICMSPIYPGRPAAYTYR